MSLIKFNNRNKLFPWNNEALKGLLSSDDFFNTDFFEENGLMPALNIKEVDNKFEIEIAAPGFAKKDFQITIDNGILNVQGNKSKETETSEDNYTRKEFNYNSFKRSLKLPDSIDINKMPKATYKDGILKVLLNKNKEVIESSKKVIKIT
ncbi:Hsp20/alpha crystallin family protein [Flavobacteriaceae bacterium AU392]|nr:Hsp20/alpha crystallin family protein [Flavobacteriaceae bacterium]RKM85930.1 Hsp20/alpha crystallin family protein [Flavobacteriaceae bacterium AU392]